MDREDRTGSDDRVQDDARIDEVLGIDRSEQPGLGGDSSVLEGYGEDVEADDLPERPVLREPILPGSDEDDGGGEGDLGAEFPERGADDPVGTRDGPADGRHDRVRRQGGLPGTGLEGTL